MKKFLVIILEKLHRMIFGHEMSDTMRRFFSNLSWSFFGILTSAGILFVINVIAGRVLGPAGFGEYNLVVTIAMFSTVFITLGFDNTAIRFIAASREREKIEKYLSNSVIAILLISLIYLTLGYLLRSQLASLLNTTNYLIGIALIYAIILTFKNFIDGVTKALEEFRYQMMVKILESLVVLMFFCYFFVYLNSGDYVRYILSLSIGGIVALLLYSHPLVFRLSWDKEVFLETQSYQKTTMLVSFVGILIATLDKFFIAKILGTEQLGLYSAYLITSTAVMSQLMMLVNNVFYPMINKVKGKKQIIRKVDLLATYMFIPFVLFSGMITFLILKLFGSQYSVNWIYILMVGIISFGQAITVIYGSITASSPNFLRFSARIYYIKPVIVLLFYYFVYILQILNLYAIFSIVIFSYVFDIINTKLTLRMAEE